MVVALTDQEKELVDQFQQLPPERQRYLMLQRFCTNADRWQRYQTEGEEQLRKLAAQRGQDWDKLNDEQRQDLVNELLRAPIDFHAWMASIEQDPMSDEAVDAVEAVVAHRRSHSKR